MDHKMSSSKSITFRDMYKELPIDIDYVTYKRILQCMCQFILEHVFMRSEGFKMPYGLGMIQVGKYRPKNYDSKSLSVDYKASKEYDKRNNHKIYKVFYSMVIY